MAPNINFYDPKLSEVSCSLEHPQQQNVSQVFFHLSVSHSVMVESNGEYSASSPDELAFVAASKNFGWTFNERDVNGDLIFVTDNLNKKKHEVLLLHQIEFTSARKCMSCVVRMDEQCWLLTKGADSVIIPQCTNPREKLTK